MSTGNTDSPAGRHGPKVFISYRRRFDSGFARLLELELTKEFGVGAVFRDVGQIAPGAPFPQVINQAIESCDTFLALISPEWVKTVASLQDPEDFVRIEIAAALAARVRVIPILLNGAQMPKKEDLPEDVRELAFRQAEELTDSRWDDDIRHLIEAVRPPSFLDKLAEVARPLFAKWQVKAGLVILLIGLLTPLMPASFFRPFFRPGGDETPTPTPAATATPGTTPTPGATPTPALTPTTTPAPLSKCFREFLPEDRWVDINYGDPDDRIVIRQNQPKGGPAGILLTGGGREVGAVRFHFVRWGKDETGGDSGYYEIEQVIGTDCRSAEGFSNLSGEGVIPGRKNWEWLDLPLGGRHYGLRIAYKEDAIVAQFLPKPN
jgi:TIR domain